MKANIVFLLFLLSACNQLENQTDKTLKSPLEEYRTCMGYSDKTLMFTNNNIGRYIVLVSDKSTEQQYANKQEFGQLYYTTLLKCDRGNSLQDCMERQKIEMHSIGTTKQWNVGEFKTFKNDDFVMQRVVKSEFLPDGRHVYYADYCRRNRNDLTKNYCGHIVMNSVWANECKGILSQE